MPSESLAHALAELRSEHPRLANEAEAALDWLSDDESFHLSQHRLQQFLWFELPRKWFVPPREQPRLFQDVREGLAWVLLRLGLERYAFMCRSTITVAVHNAYLQSARDGSRVAKRAFDGSGIEPPDLADFRWGGLMGFEEARARDHVTDTLEAAVASGVLPVGSRGWRPQQRQLAAAALEQAHPERPSRTWLQVIHEERIEHWCGAPLGAEMTELRQRAAARVATPIPTPHGLDAAFEPLRWFLTAIGDGVRLTATGNLAREFVLDAAQQRGWWPPVGAVRGEDDVSELGALHEATLTLRAAQARNGKLRCTALGRQLVQEPDRMWNEFVSLLVRQPPFAAVALEALSLILLLRPTGPQWTTLEEVAVVLAAEGFHSPDGAVPAGTDVAWHVADLLHLLALVNMVDISGAWDARQLAVTPLGESTLWALLRARATAPLVWDGP